MQSKKTLDMTQGPVTGKLLSFAVPIIITNLIQQMYTIADRVVVGRFAENGTTALAAVGSTGAITVLFLNLFYGMALGANVTCANYRGAKDGPNLERCMHTAVPFALLGGVIVSILGQFVIVPLLRLLSTPEALMELAELYLRIYFLGVPAILTYNCGANLLRAHGDTKRPMYLLIATGLVNVCLNLVFVIGLHMSVAGVAIATITAQYLNAAVVLWILFSPKGEYKMSVKKLCLDKKMLYSIAKIGIPAGLNATVFSLSNTIILTGVNSFNSAIISAAKTAVSDLSTMIYQVIMGFYAACVRFSGQCFGAKKYRRIDRLGLTAVGVGSAILVVVGVAYTIFGRQLMGLFNSNPEVVEAGLGALMINAWFYFLYLIAEVPLGCTRGMKKSVMPGMLNVIGICAPRILWVAFVFSALKSGVILHDYGVLLLCYPLSWGISGIFQFFCYRYYRKRLKPETE